MGTGGASCPVIVLFMHVVACQCESGPSKRSPAHILIVIVQMLGNVGWPATCMHGLRGQHRTSRLKATTQKGLSTYIPDPDLTRRTRGSIRHASSPFSFVSHRAAAPTQREGRLTPPRLTQRFMAHSSAQRKSKQQGEYR